MAEYVVVPARYLTTAPSTVPLDDAAGIPTAAGTALQALFESVSLTGGQSVLIHAGAGGVGSFAIQFARDAGARVSATASGDGVSIARQLGADTDRTSVGEGKRVSVRVDLGGRAIIKINSTR